MDWWEHLHRKNIQFRVIFSLKKQWGVFLSHRAPPRMSSNIINYHPWTHPWKHPWTHPWNHPFFSMGFSHPNPPSDGFWATPQGPFWVDPMSCSWPRWPPARRSDPGSISMAERVFWWCRAMENPGKIDEKMGGSLISENHQLDLVRFDLDSWRFFFVAFSWSAWSAWNI